MSATTVAICVKVVPLDERSITNAVSLLELSLQARLIWLVDIAEAVRLLGAAGRAAEVVALATLEYAELPTVLLARTR